MTGMFPGSGVPPTEAKNSLLDPDTINCDELWYSTSRCQPRFDPAAANAELSELLNVIAAGQVQYDCSKLDQVQLAIKYLIQKGQPQAVDFFGGPLSFTAQMDPILQHYSNRMVISGTLRTDLAGPMRVNIDNQGDTPVVRNDGQELKQNDLRAAIPFLAVYYAGKFYIPYLVPSQAPTPFKGSVTYWVRTDGSDVTGDGSANSPAKAFRTINHAYLTGITNFMVNPDLTLDIRLGIPGIYDYAQFGPFPGTVQLTGDPTGTNFLNYKIQSSIVNAGYTCIEVDGAAAILTGINLLMNAVSPQGNSVGLLCWRQSRCTINSCGFDNSTGANGVSNQKNHIICAVYSTVSLATGNIIFDSHGSTLNSSLSATGNGTITTIGYETAPVTVTYKDTTYTSGGYAASNLSSIGVQDSVINGVTLATVNISNTNGPKYVASINSSINGGNKPIPGSVAGSVSDYGVFHA